MSTALVPTYAPARELSVQEREDLAKIVAVLPPRGSVPKVRKYLKPLAVIWTLMLIAAIACWALPVGLFVKIMLTVQVFFWSLPFGAGVIALAAGAGDDSRAGGYSNLAERALCEYPEMISCVRVLVGDGGVESVVVETPNDGCIILRPPSGRAADLVSALGRWCRYAAIEIPSWWQDPSAPAGTVVLRSFSGPTIIHQRPALPSARLLR